MQSTQVYAKEKCAASAGTGAHGGGSGGGLRRRRKLGGWHSSDTQKYRDVLDKDAPQQTFTPNIHNNKNAQITNAYIPTLIGKTADLDTSPYGDKSVSNHKGNGQPNDKCSEKAIASV